MEAKTGIKASAGVIASLDEKEYISRNGKVGGYTEKSTQTRETKVFSRMRKFWLFSLIPNMYGLVHYNILMYPIRVFLKISTIKIPIFTESRFLVENPLIHLHYLYGVDDQDP